MFKTLRHPGHPDYTHFLLRDLGLERRIYQFRSLLMTSPPKTGCALVLIALRVVPEPGPPPQWQPHVLEARAGATGRMSGTSGTATAAYACATLDLPIRWAFHGLDRPGHHPARRLAAPGIL